MQRSPAPLWPGGAWGSKVETAGGVFQVREDEPAPPVGAGLHRTPLRPEGSRVGGVNGPRSSAVADIKEYVRSGDHGTETRGLSSCGGVGLMAAGRSFATSPSEDITRRLAQAQQDGKVDGLHTLLVSQGGKLVTEHYGRGEDE